MKVIIENNYSFVFKIINSKFRVTELYIPQIMDVFQYFDGIHNNYSSLLDKAKPSSLEKIINALRLTIAENQVRRVGGGEEAFLEIDNEWTRLFLTLPIDFPKYEVESKSLLNILESYKLWLIDIESCQVAGLVPESKLYTWSCVPNEYIKDEWWEIQKQKKIDKSGA